MSEATTARAVDYLKDKREDEQAKIKDLMQFPRNAPFIPKRQELVDSMTRAISILETAEITRGAIDDAQAIRILTERRDSYQQAAEYLQSQPEQQHHAPKRYHIAQALTDAIRVLNGDEAAPLVSSPLTGTIGTYTVQAATDPDGTIRARFTDENPVNSFRQAFNSLQEFAILLLKLADTNN